MIKLGVNIYIILFYLVITSALICFTINSIRIVLRKDYSLIPFSIFYLFSGFVSTFSIFSDNKLLVQSLIFFFYSFDLLFFLLYVRNFQVTSKKRVTTFIALGILFIIVFFTSSITNVVVYKFWYNFIFQIFILLISMPIMIRLLKDVDNKIELPRFEYWFISAFFFLNLSTLPGSFILAYKSITISILLETFCYTILRIAWIVKYYLLLKSTLWKGK